MFHFSKNEYTTYMYIPVHTYVYIQCTITNEPKAKKILKHYPKAHFHEPKGSSREPNELFWEPFVSSREPSKTDYNSGSSSTSCKKISK